ncbi:hypothetical protein AA0488_0578 [Kozakia baliensis NRIC 0488]|uniref:Uncharacterized protein n=1 Tax=Kozakia baliensis TaxID=153496 RepID=A0A1D8UTP0_9PROT|nr:hypothetical protein A0U89_07550 [Kozakia baliensis]GBR25179.1 hypothetical protein AA0488_0578 [Kozakia baliensis NRIC 0488]GEL63919.1 hypothetical protein KBA01_12050 [Kozakia baliensis]
MPEGIPIGVPVRVQRKTTRNEKSARDDAMVAKVLNIGGGLPRGGENAKPLFMKSLYRKVRWPGRSLALERIPL